VKEVSGVNWLGIRSSGLVSMDIIMSFTSWKFFIPADSLGLCELSKRSFTVTPVILEICIS
jgi:hypothetical protein